MSHTPAPWSSTVGNVCRVYKSDRNICSISKRGRTHDEYTANARLIAAAPDLLSALASLLIIIPDQHEIQGHIDAAHKAIAKARS